jgi:chromatin remodeling complex protein RSC6
VPAKKAAKNSIFVEKLAQAKGPKFTTEKALKAAVAGSSVKKLLIPSAKFARVVGAEPISPDEARRRVWKYVREKNLRPSAYRVTLDAKLQAALAFEVKDSPKASKGTKGGKGTGGERSDDPGPSITLYAFRKLLSKQGG